MLYWLSTGDGQSYGPYDIATLQSFAAEGRIDASAQLCAEGSTEWVPASSVVAIPTRAPTLGADAVVGAAAPPFLYISITRLLCMSLVTLGFYCAYWIYRNWRFIEARESLAMWPFWRGIFGVFWIYPLLKKMRDGDPQRGVAAEGFSAGGLAAGFIIVQVLGNCLGRAPSPGVNLVGALVGLAGPLFLIPVQRHINARIEAGSQRPDYYPFSAGHIVCTVWGAIVWLVLLAAFVPDTDRY